MCRPRLSFNLQPGREQYGEVTNVRFTPESGLNSDISAMSAMGQKRKSP